MTGLSCVRPGHGVDTRDTREPAHGQGLWPNERAVRPGRSRGIRV